MVNKVHYFWRVEMNFLVYPVITCAILFSQQSLDNQKLVPGPVFQMAFAPGSGVLVTGAGDGSIIEWTTDATPGIRRVVREGLIRAGQQDPGQRVLIGDTIRALDVLSSGEIRAVIAPMTATWRLASFSTETHEGVLPDQVTAAAFSPDHSTIALGRKDGFVHLMRIDSKETRSFGIGHTGAVDSLAFTPDGELVSLGLDGTIIVWSLSTMEPRLRIEVQTYVDNLASIAIAPGGNMIVGTFANSAARSGVIHFWSLADGAPIGQLTVPKSLPMEAVFSPDGRRLAIMIVGSLEVFDTSTWRPIIVIKEPQQTEFTAIAFSPSSEELAIATVDFADHGAGSVRIVPVPLIR